MILNAYYFFYFSGTLETKSKPQNYIPLKEKLSCQRAVLPKCEMGKPVKNPKPLRNVSKSDHICPIKPTDKTKTDIKINENKIKSNSHGNKDCNEMVIEESYCKMNVEVNHTDELRKFSTASVINVSETRQSNMESKSSNRTVYNLCDSKATIPPIENNIHSSHNTFTGNYLINFSVL